MIGACSSAVSNPPRTPTRPVAHDREPQEQEPQEQECNLLTKAQLNDQAFARDDKSGGTGISPIAPLAAYDSRHAHLAFSASEDHRQHVGDSQHLAPQALLASLIRAVLAGPVDPCVSLSIELQPGASSGS
jgi:hypothetical protein